MAAKPRESEVQFSVTLSQKVADVITNSPTMKVPEEGSPVLLGRIATNLLGQLASGGMMLDPNSTQRIFDVLPNADPQQVATAVEQSRNRKGGQVHYTFAMDPVFLGPLEEIARMQGRPVEDVIQEGVNHIFQMGGLYHLPNDFIQMRLDAADHRMLTQAMGLRDDEHFSGTELAEFVRSKVLGAPDTEEDLSFFDQAARSEVEA